MDTDSEDEGNDEVNELRQQLHNFFEASSANAQQKPSLRANTLIGATSQSK